MRKLLFGLMLLLFGLATVANAADTVIGDFATTTIPVWGDTLSVDSTAVDTSGAVWIQDSGIISVQAWADSIGGAGVVDVKIEYQLLSFDVVYVTAVAETLSTMHPVGRIVKFGSTLYPVQNDGNAWTTIWSSLSLYDNRDTKSIQPPLADYLRFRVTGNSLNGAYTQVKIWVRKEP